MKHFWLALVASFGAFLSGYQYHQYRYGEVSLSHNMLIDGDPYNRGQISLEVRFPSSIRLGQIRLPYGGVYPDGRPRWSEVIGPNGETKDWIDRLSFETYEFGKKAAPTFAEACVQSPKPGCPLVH